MMQLIGPNIYMLDTMKNKWFGVDEGEEKFGVPPDKVVDVMGLMGDSSDHIPGVRGVGPKTASELIRRFGSMYELYERIDEVDKAKLKEKLVKDREMALLSRDLVTINKSMELPGGLEDMKFKSPDNSELRKLFSEFEFSSLLGELGDDPEVSFPETKSHYETILTEVDLERWF